MKEKWALITNKQEVLKDVCFCKDSGHGSPVCPQKNN